MRILKVIDHIAAICGNPSKSYIRSVLRSFKTLNDSNQLKRLRTITEVISNTQVQNGGLVPNKLLRDRTKSDYEEMVRLYIISIFSIKKFKSAT